MERMRELVDILNKASESYYAKDEEIMSNFEYDALYDELVKLEEETGIVLSNSPTRHVGYEAVDFLPKETHDRPMLSLNKTKSREELADWAGDRECLISWKLDGLTIVLTYENGELAKAVTRGNGEVGEVITANARTFTNIPLKIAFKGKLVLRGEAVISYADFEKINAEITDDEDKYKNPRNLCSGSVRQLNSEITAKRHVRLIAFSLVLSEGREFKTRSEQFDFLASLGFEVVEHYKTTGAGVADRIAYFAEKVADYEILAHWWANEIKRANELKPSNNVKLYIGMAPYRLENASPKGKTNAWNTGNEIGRQMKLNRTIPEISGECFYSTRPLLRNPRHVCDTIRLIYKEDNAQKEAILLPWE